MTLSKQKNALLIFGVIIAVLLLDFFTKWLAQAYIPYAGSHAASYPYGGIAIADNLLGIQIAIIHNINRGAAWGILSQWQEYLLYFRILLIGGLVVFVIRNKNISWDVPLALIIGGAIGNVLDYFLYGHVIDMLQIVFWGYDYPTFNVADAAIFIGIASLLVKTWKEKKANITLHPS